VAGPDGALWFSNGDSIGRITTDGRVRTFRSTGALGIWGPSGIAVGSDGALWFTVVTNFAIGRISTDGAVRLYSAAGIEAPYGIAAGPDGALWFANFNSIGRIGTDGAVTTYAVTYPTQATVTMGAASAK
jgi:virginiamycin B lyase